MTELESKPGMYAKAYISTPSSVQEREKKKRKIRRLIRSISCPTELEASQRKGKGAQSIIRQKMIKISDELRDIKKFGRLIQIVI